MDIIIIAILSGLILGSFLNAWLWRTYHVVPMKGRSMCTSCRTTIVWYDNIPVVSYIILRGKCRSCSQPIPLQYLLIELWLPFAFMLSAWASHSAFTPFLVIDWIIIFLLTFIFVYDYRYQLILDRTTTIPALILLCIYWFVGFHTLSSMLLGAAVVAGFFYLQFILSKGRWIGGGDIRLGLFMGVVLGWPLALVALFLAYIIGAIISIMLLVFKKAERASKTPFGTYLALATFITMIWGTQFLEWYLSF